MKMTPLGMVMLGFIGTASLVAAIGSWFNNGDLILCAVLLMLQFLTIAVNEGIQVLRQIRDNTNREQR